ncbi:hypothetical protein CYMTET_35615 [Cymbomonas tetramitiformis]|uniref:Uncharacterized protein n=1 Tax=Cymbomonas tetramitiformis TaxID=36881 RepID=A0AAE0F8P0_9CHLO|nr:hypothetical protein CYMTET_35615 [Cymbomonas tetramitiformis]
MRTAVFDCAQEVRLLHDEGFNRDFEIYASPFFEYDKCVVRDLPNKRAYPMRSKHGPVDTDFHVLQRLHLSHGSGLHSLDSVHVVYAMPAAPKDVHLDVLRRHFQPNEIELTDGPDEGGIEWLQNRFYNATKITLPVEIVCKIAKYAMRLAYREAFSQSLIGGVPKSVNIDLSDGCTRSCQTHLQALHKQKAWSCGSLERMWLVVPDFLNNEDSLSMTHVQLILNTAARGLVQLEICGDRSDVDVACFFDDDAMATVGRQCHNLRILVVHNAPKITDTGVSYIEQAKNLEHVTLASCKNMRDPFRDFQCDAWPKLKELVLFGNNQLATPSLFKIAFLSNCITHLDICYVFEEASAATLRRIVKAWSSRMPKLKTLVLETELSDNEEHMILFSEFAEKYASARVMFG